MSKEEIIAYIKIGKSCKEIADLCGVSIRTAQRYKKEYETTNDKEKPETKREKKAKAKAVVVSGKTLREASEKSGLPMTTIKEYSVKEGWIEERKKYNQYIFERLLEEKAVEHIEIRKKALEYLSFIQNKTMVKLNNEELTPDIALSLERATNIVLKTIKGQADLLGITEIKDMVDMDIAIQKLELEKEKRATAEKDKTGTFLDIIEDFL